MLKLIHVQARLNIDKGRATVKQMEASEPQDRKRAEQVIEIFRQAQEDGLTREALYARLAAYTDIRLDYREIDGLAKVICDSFATFQPDSTALVPVEIETTKAKDSDNQKKSALEVTGADKPAPGPLLQEVGLDAAGVLPGSDEEAIRPESSLSAFRLAVWREAAKSEFYPFNHSGLTVALKPGVQSLRRAAAAYDPDLLARLLPAEKRLKLLQRAAAACGYNLSNPPDQAKLGDLLFADVPNRHRLIELSPELNVENLLNRYNVELLRGVLYLTPRMRITVRDKYKDLFKYIKFFGLMHDVKPLPKERTLEGEAVEPAENEIGGYEIVLEGASSPFLARSDRRYGIQFAKFLPALLLCEAEWQLEAELVFVPAGAANPRQAEDGTGKGKPRVTRALFKLGPQPHLRTHFKGSGEFDSLLEQSLAVAFEERFKTTTRKPAIVVEAAFQSEMEGEAVTVSAKPTRKRKKTPPPADTREGWTILREDRIISVFDTVMIPDFAFEHSDGRRALLEVVGFWERGYLERKIAKLNRAGRSDFIVLVSERTRCGRENFLVKGQEPPYQLIFFKGTPRLTPIIEALERCARPVAVESSQ